MPNNSFTPGALFTKLGEGAKYNFLVNGYCYRERPGLDGLDNVMSAATAFVTGLPPAPAGKNYCGELTVPHFSTYRNRADDWSKDGTYAKPEKDVKSAGFLSSFVDNINVSAMGVSETSANGSNIDSGLVFLDCGRWKGHARDFGLIWGHHVYLCSYDQNGYIHDEKPPQVFTDSGNMRAGNDYSFFKAFDSHYVPEPSGVGRDYYDWLNNKVGRGRIQIIAHTIAKPIDNAATDYNWDQLYVIIPDLHTMARDTAEKWYLTTSFVQNAPAFMLDAELALMDFVEDLIAITKAGSDLANHVKIIQIGDAYDLWVGANEAVNRPAGVSADAYTPYFNHTTNQTLVLPTENIEWATKMLKRIQAYSSDDFDKTSQNRLIEDSYFFKALESARYSPIKDMILPGDNFPAGTYLNPAEAALRRLQQAFGGDYQNLAPNDNLIYIHGNHDNVLINTAFVNSVNAPYTAPRSGKYPTVAPVKPLWKRRAFWEDKGLFVEHGQRMEVYFEKTIARQEVPTNEDGAYGGFKATIEAYQGKATAKGPFTLLTAVEKADFADKWAGRHDQPAIAKEFGRYWLGRKCAYTVAQKQGEQLPPAPHGIFVIGHTHMPALFNYDKIRFPPHVVVQRSTMKV